MRKKSVMTYIKISEDKAVKTDMEKPNPNKYSHWSGYEAAKTIYQNNLNDLPTFEVPESMKSLPVGSEMTGVREQHQFQNDNGEWEDVKPLQVFSLPPKTRKVLVPIKTDIEKFIEREFPGQEYHKLDFPPPHLSQEAPEQGEVETIDYIHKGIEFSKKDGLITTPESYRLGAGYGYSCGYQDGVNSVLLPTLQPKGMTDYETALKWYAKGKDSSPELEKTEFNSFYSHLFNPNGTLK